MRRKFSILLLAGILHTFNKRTLSKYKFGEISKNSKIVHFDPFLLSKSYKVLAKKVQNNDFLWHWKMMQSLKKKWLLVLNMTWRIWWIFTQPLESLKIFFQWALFVSNIQNLKYNRGEEYRGVEYSYYS